MAVFYSIVLVGAGLVEFQIMGAIQSFMIELASDGELVLGESRRIIGVLIFQPIFIYLLSLITGDKFRKIADFIAAGTFICFVFGKIACLLEGCCHGFPNPNGVYSAYGEGLVVPVQLYESLSTIPVVIFLTILLSKKIKLRPGCLFPIGCIGYSAVRIFWENYRYYDNQWESNYFHGLNFWQLWCVISIIISVIWIIVIYALPKYAECSMETNQNALLPKIIAFICSWYDSKKAEKAKIIVHHNKNKKKYHKK